MYKKDLALNDLPWLICHKIKPNLELSLPLIPGPLWSGVVESVRVPSIGQIELFEHLTECKQITDFKLNCYCYTAILETIQLCANEWVMLNKIISDE